MRRAYRIFLSTALLLASVGTSVAEDRYWFRFPTSSAIGGVDQQPVSKNISAYFIAGLGKEFSEQIPMKAEWEDNRWEIVEGSPPLGLSFDPATRTFSGVATSAVRNMALKLVGYDALGNVEAEAEVKFDVYELPASTQQANLYAHTNKFFTTNLSMPSNTVVERWESISPPPPGLSYNGRFVEGIPTKAGSYPILNIGYDYGNNAVIAYHGNFAVEDGPTFAFIPDDLRTVALQGGCDIGYECARWANERLPEARSTIGGWNKVRYVYEVQGELPSGFSIRQESAPRAPAYTNGRVFDFYDQASIRIRAIDTDGAVGFSNWFKVGSLGPEELCKPANGKSFVELNTVLGADFFEGGYKIPVGLGVSGLNMSVKSGALPDGIRLDPGNGYLFGSATKQQETTFSIEAAIPGNPDFEPVECGPYKVIVSPGEFNLEVLQNPPVYRVGDEIDLGFVASGMILSGYSAELASDESSLPIGLTFAADGDKKWKLSGALIEPGQYEAVVRLTNGDGVEKLNSAMFSVVDDMKIAEVPGNEISVQQFATKTASDPFYVFSWENAIGAAEISFQGDISGLALDGAHLWGGTVLAPGSYGPFTVSVTDGTESTVVSDEFRIRVTEREGLKSSGTAEKVSFTVNVQSAIAPFDVKQEELAASVYTLDYTIEPELPSGFRLDPKTGIIEGKASAKGDYTGFVITATETGLAGGQTLVSQPFDISVSDPADIGDLRVAVLEGNRNGVRIASTDPVAILNANKMNIVGSVDDVRFTNAAPAIAGLTFDEETGTISGIPSEEFDGDVRIDLVDSVGRPGAIVVPVKIYSPLALTSAQTTYAVPRLTTSTSGFAKIAVNTGFYKGAEFSISQAHDPLPEGLTISQTGVIVGRTMDSVGSTKNVVVRGTSLANGLTAELPLTFVVENPADLLLEFEEQTVTQFNINRDSRLVESSGVLNASTYLRGSYVAPLTWSVSDGPAWLSINSETGVLTATGRVENVGEYPVTVTAVDAEGRRASDQTRVLAKTAGKITADPGNEGFVVRSGETFRTSTQALANATAPFTLWSDPEMPETFTFNSDTGSVLGRFDDAGIYRWRLLVEDAEARGFDAPLEITVNVRDYLKFPSVVSNPVDAVQYDTSNAMTVRFPTPQNSLGGLSYRVDGTVPGTLYYRAVDQTGVVSFTKYEQNGQATVAVVQGGQTEGAVVASFPPDHIIFDAESLVLSGVPSKVGSFDLRLNAVDDHRSTGYQVNEDDQTRQSANQAISSVYTVHVAPKPAMELLSSKLLPRYAIVDSQDVDLDVVAENYAYRVTGWQVTGDLPPGVTYEANGNTLAFSGTSNVIGDYPLDLTATDAMGATKTLTALIKVVQSPLAIQLFVSDIKAKVGIPFVMDGLFAEAQPRVENAYGVVTYNSLDAANYGVTVDRTTGAVSGLRDVAGDFTVNITATDQTNRITSKPVRVVMIPNLRVQYPSRLEVEQGISMNQAVSVDHALGAVTYVKGQGDWPAGMDVNEATGAIVGVPTGAVREYAGLTVVGTDAVGDVQASNAFTINVKELQADPIIQPVVVPDLLNGQAMAAVVPSVLDSELDKPWAYAGNVFSLNKPLPAGLAFDTATGTISGTPSAIGNFTGYEVAVTAPNGVSTKTPAFAIKVVPVGGITFQAGQKTEYVVRKGRSITTEPIIAENVWGDLSWSFVGTPVGFTINPANGVVTGGATVALNTAQYVSARVTDGLGRSAVFQFRVPAIPDMIATQPPQSVVENVATNISRPSISGLYGTPSYSYSGLPAGITMNADGSLTGTLSQRGSWLVTFTVTDGYDNYSTSLTFSITVMGAQYQRLLVKTWVPHHSSPYCVGFSEIEFFSNAENITSASTYAVTKPDPTYPLVNATDGNLKNLFFMNDATDHSIRIGTPDSKPITSFKMTFRHDGGGGACSPKTWDIQQSENGTSWTTVWSGSTTVYTGTITSSR